MASHTASLVRFSVPLLLEGPLADGHLGGAILARGDLADAYWLSVLVRRDVVARGHGIADAGPAGGPVARGYGGLSGQAPPTRRWRIRWCQSDNPQRSVCSLLRQSRCVDPEPRGPLQISAARMLVGASVLLAG